MRRRTVLRAGGLAALTTAGTAMALSTTGRRAALPRVLLLGDSLTYGQSTPTRSLAGGFREPLHDLLDPAHRFVGTRRDNASARLRDAGQDAHEGWPGFRVDQVAALRLPAAEVAVVLLGTNDVGQRFDPTGAPDLADPAAVQAFATRAAARLEALLDALPVQQVVLCSPPPYLRLPSDLRPDVVSVAYDAAVQRLARRRGLALVDLFGLCLLPDGQVDRALLGEDGTHLTDTGYQLAAARMAPLVRAGLERVRA